MSWQEKPWVRAFSLSLKIALALALLYVGYDYFQRRALREAIEREHAKPEEKPLQEDLYVHLPKSYVSSPGSARRRLIGKPLWVREGWRWPYEPDGKLFEPLERITPTRVVERGSETLIEFEKDGQTCHFAIGAGLSFYVDEIFLIKDPHELYSHWTEEDWAKIARHEAEEGMSEFQVSFALGASSLISASQHSPIRIVEYTAGREAGVQPVRVTYRDWIAERIEPLEEESTVR